ncbi:hypothetical protein ACFVWG_18435 [Kribbella sp. NPDC058245]|uniref:hypothetical protein n=1 Tax=Kribbella sp. NPDC058245 TaxID=3346399 RepID=UPI0036EC4399
MSDELHEVNRCLAQYDVVMYRDDDGRLRIYGDINRIQDIIFGPCLAKFPPGGRKELDAFFAEEVDFRLARIMRREGIDAVIDLSESIGIEIRGEPPTDELYEACFKELHDWYRIPPGDRPVEVVPAVKPTSIGVKEGPPN